MTGTFQGLKGVKVGSAQSGFGGETTYRLLQHACIYPNLNAYTYYLNSVPLFQTSI